jgi:hypothetical protein
MLSARVEELNRNISNLGARPAAAKRAPATTAGAAAAKRKPARKPA